MLSTHPKATRELSDLPDLGGGKERSVTYESHLCTTAQEVDTVLNQDKYAYNYIYWNSHPDGLMITICKPNPKAFTQRAEKRIEKGLLELSESDATITTQTILPNNLNDKNECKFIIASLYDKGFVVCKKMDEVRK